MSTLSTFLRGGVILYRRGRKFATPPPPFVPPEAAARALTLRGPIYDGLEQTIDTPGSASRWREISDKDTSSFKDTKPVGGEQGQSHSEQEPHNSSSPPRKRMPPTPIKCIICQSVFSEHKFIGNTEHLKTCTYFQVQYPLTAIWVVPGLPDPVTGPDAVKLIKDL